MYQNISDTARTSLGVWTKLMKKMKKNGRRSIEEWGNVPPLPTWGWESGYASAKHARIPLILQRVYLHAQKGRYQHPHTTIARAGIDVKDLRGNPKPRVSPDRTQTGPGSGNIFKNIFGSGRVMEFYFGSVWVGEFISGRSGSRYFLPGYETFSPGILGINLPFIPKLRK